MDLFVVMPQRAVVFAGPRRQVAHRGAFTWKARWQEEVFSLKNGQLESVMLETAV